MKTDSKILIGNTLRKLKENNGMDSKEVAKILGVKYDTYRSWESGRSAPMHEMVIQLSKLYNVSCDYILTGEMDMPFRVASDNNYNKSIYGDHYVSELSPYEKQILLRLRLLNREDKSKVAEFVYELTPKMDEE